MAIVDRAPPPRRGFPAGGTEPEQAAGERRAWREDLFAPAVRWLPGPVDVLIAQAIGVLQLLGTLVYSAHEPTAWAFDTGAAALLAVGPVTLLVRRRWPDAVLVVTFAAAVGYAATGYPRGPAGIPAFMVALVTAILMGRRALAWAVAVVAVPVLTLLPRPTPDGPDRGPSTTTSAANHTGILLVAAASELARVRVERRAERAQVEREEARHRASQERLLIARELHDVLAHHISLISVQSGVALHLLDERPEHARSALAAINEASDVALDELRSVLDVLSRGESDGGPWAPLAPAAGLGELDGVVSRARGAGLDVDLSVDGEPRSVATGVDLAAFRVVQEALTNVVRHAGAARATVRIGYEPRELVVQVDDDGPGAAEGGSRPTVAGAGRGIAGMRERVHTLGGTFTAGPRPGRGFRVRARFPLRDGRR